MTKRSVHQLTDPKTIEALCQIQQDFVRLWNHREETWTHPRESDHALPHGAEYSGSIHPDAGGKIGANFLLPDRQASVCLLAVRSWKHWHEGWSFCRNTLTPDQLRKVVVVGSMDAFNDWFAKVTSATLTPTT